MSKNSVKPMIFSTRFHETRRWIPFIALSLITLHGVLYILNQIVVNSDNLAVRLIVISTLAPYLFSTWIRDRRTIKLLATAFLPVLFYAGPGFMIIAVFVELSSMNPDLQHLLRREYELIFACVIFVLFVNNWKIGVTLCLCGTVATLSINLMLIPIDAELLAETTGVLISAWIFGILTAAVAVTNSTAEATGRKASMADLGSTIAHELRTPLLSIQTRATLLARHLNHHEVNTGGSDTVNKKLIEKSATDILKEVESSFTLIDMLLVNSSYQDKTHPIDVFNVDDAVQEALDRYPYGSSNEKKLLFTSLRSAENIRGPRILFIHVIFNLLKNALQHVDAKKKNPQINIVSCVSGKHIHLVVCDNGLGINPKNLTRIFQPFFSTNQHTGSGIGLTFVEYTIRHLFDAELSYRSKAQTFTSIDIKIPAAG